MAAKIGKIKTGKIITTVIILIFTVIGVILIFGDIPIDRMTAYKMLLSAIFPYLIPILSGVALKGLVKSILQNKGEK